ncbi:polyketide synthase [Fusarium circinatum]|uniref:Polyketide synthase n=1 Tax=Fusarium circinatum TaxID=48490 RepID=A0A8H5SXU3_FUSCI|nr:polyketide synthase [Fusarium circinatum]
MAIVDINTVLDPPAKLAEKVKDTLRAMPPRPSDEIRMKHRWYQCTVQNATQFEIRLENSYFNAGKYLTAPQSVGPYGQMTFTAYHDRLGVSTGLSFSANLDEIHRSYFAIGLDAPYMGGFRAGVVESNSAKEGLDIVTREGNSVILKQKYKGKDSNGDDQVIEFHLAAYPGMEMKVIITQLIVNNNDE